MSTGRTHDSEITIGGAGWIIEPDIMSWSITEKASISGFPVIQQDGMSQFISGTGLTFSANMLTNDDTDTLLANRGDTEAWVIIQDNTNACFEAIPVIMSGLPINAPPADAITMSLTLQSRGRPAYDVDSVNNTDFDFKSGTVSASISGTITKTNLALMAIETIGSGVGVELHRGNNDFEVASAIGIYEVNWPAETAWPASMTGVTIEVASGETAKGSFYQATPMTLPTG